MNPEADFTRKRKLTLEKAIDCLLTLEEKSLSSELMSFTNYDIETPTSSAFIQARDKISIEAFKAIFNQLNAAYTNWPTFKGYRLLAHDGSNLNMPYEPNDPLILTYNGQTAYSLLHLNALYDPLSKLYMSLDYQGTKETDERLRLLRMVANLPPTQAATIILADRGYESFNVYEHLTKAGHKFIIRA